mmetsp:Transcript_10459/g.22162  ORF Transcript_10459/g.22162 Transcript_10459/m.22162 type:complete len:437 (+) Transcript_10459:121-1431(+)|eukprot:CAMPEP_0201165332 /NCGR_PEP_ID=MMETSP0851-20130426/63024_1 /ASSEMBLY_ACC=CAM_ASM_000631 /TAXON_ID=183588 /ORGANISM="Pseudo-nitzschia fraudulenta, Strain WWA7" /LENGTH=436 /DNA_ID=CAMNT_0047445957 /DNA_START=107 /DNA_END=1417 /DNA_ORIENTATION=+
MKTTTALFLLLSQWRVADGFVQRQQQSASASASASVLPSLSIASMDDLTFSIPDTSLVEEKACIDAANKMRRIAIPSENSPSGSVGVSYIHWPANAAKKKKIGSPPPLILLHGFDSSCLEYRRLGPQLAEQGIDAYAVDILGWGFTQLDDVNSFSADAKVETLKGFVKTVFGGDSAFCVAGASLGGAASIELAAALTIDDPNAADDEDSEDDTDETDGLPSCAGLVLIDAQGFVDGVGPMAMLPKPLAKIGVGVLKSVPLRNMANQMSYFDTDTFATEDAQVIGRLHTLRDGWSDAMVSFMQSGGFSPSSKVSKINSPALVLWGREDGILDGTEFANKFVEELPDAELKWVEECGHVPHLEQPEETASIILSFLTSDRVIAATAAAAKSNRKSGSAASSDSGDSEGIPPLILGGGFLGAISGAYLLEEVIKNLIGL